MNFLQYFLAFYFAVAAAASGANGASSSQEPDRHHDSRSSLMQRLKDRRGKESGGIPDISGGSLKSGSASKSWDNFVGMHSDEVMKTIASERPELKVHVVPEGSMVTMDFRTDRVRVFVDKDGKVTSTPRIG